MLGQQFGCGGKALCDELLEAQKKINRREVRDIWEKIPKKDTRKKYTHIALPLDLRFSVLMMLMEPEAIPLASTNTYETLVISTGEYYPLNSSGYYTTLKKHAEVWLEYLEKNREKYEPGRWIRYGKYVD